MRRVISVTRRHLDFLFNREETVVTGWAYPPDAEDMRRRLAEGEGDHLLPPSDESKVGQD